MKTDNNWHEGIIYQYADGNKEFQLAENIVEGIEDPRPKEMINGRVKYQNVKYNWNHGQPIVDFGDFKMTIVDIDKGVRINEVSY
jgi:hypothetical protein